MKRSGFTLVELLVVIAIIGLLAAIGIPAILNAQRASRDATRTKQIEPLRNAMANFYSRYQIVPNSVYSNSGCTNAIGYSGTVASPLYIGAGNSRTCEKVELTDGYSIAVVATCATEKSNDKEIRFEIDSNSINYCSERLGKSTELKFKD